MIKKIYGNSFFLMASSVFFCSSIFIHYRTTYPTIRVEKQDSAVNINRDFLKLFSFGNKRLFADLLWIQTLLESDEVRYKGRDLNNWLYHRFRTISELDKPFYQNYLWGGMFLSIITDDLEGAAQIYELGLVEYPKDYKLNYNAGFNYYFEMADYKRGLEKLLVIENFPETPLPIKFVINKLKFQTTGNYEAAIELLTHNINHTLDESIRNKLIAERFSLIAERDLKCLNENKSDCNRVDADRNPYLYRDGKWISSKEFRPYKIFRRMDQENKKGQP